MKCCPKCIASCSFSEVILVLFSNFNGVHWFERLYSSHQGPIFTFAIYIQANFSETVHAVTNVCMKHICKVIYDLSVYLVTFDLGLPLNVKSWSRTFQWVVSHKWCIIWSKFAWNTYSKNITLWPFSLPYNIWPLIKLKEQIKVIGFSAGYISVTKHVLAIVY